MTKAILILTDGMADEPIAELGHKTPTEFAHTPNLDRIAERGASGTFLSLPEGFPDSSDVANLAVMGYDLATCYCGRGPLEALSQGIHLGPGDIAWRCNLIEVRDGILEDYSGGHLGDTEAKVLIRDLAAQFDSPQVTFHPGVSYRNILVLHGEGFSDRVAYHKPDASQGLAVADLALRGVDGVPHSQATADFLNALREETADFLAHHPVNEGREHPANMIWPWSPGRRPAMEPFHQKYGGARGAVVSAVDVIFGLGAAAEMTQVRVSGATGYIDTNYEGKAAAAVNALADHDFVYLHVEAADEVSHMGDVDLKLRTIEDIDARLVGPVLEGLGEREVTVAVAPDHPVPVKLRCHTRTPVPIAICGPHITPDTIATYSEQLAPTGALGALHGDQFVRRILNLG